MISARFRHPDYLNKAPDSFFISRNQPFLLNWAYILFSSHGFSWENNFQVQELNLFTLPRSEMFIATSARSKISPGRSENRQRHIRRGIQRDCAPTEAAANGRFEPFKTSSIFDGTAENPQWLGEEPAEVRALMPAQA